MTKILLVEDDKSLREIYGVRLLAEGYEIVSAGDGEEALAIAIKERPNLIISDVMMPKISGFDMLDILRSTTETKDIKVIMMTALSSDDQRARGESLGADRYLVKSQVGIEDVVRTVHDVMSDGVATAQPAPQPFTSPTPAADPDANLTPAPELASAPAPIDTPVQLPVSDVSVPEPVVIPPEPAFQAPEPVAPVEPAPAPTPVSVPPIINIPPEVPAAFQPAPNPLPQPTAPFSSNRPDSLGDRIIHPLSEAPAPVDMGSLMSQELNNSEAPAAITEPATEAAPIATAAPTDTPQA